MAQNPAQLELPWDAPRPAGDARRRTILIGPRAVDYELVRSRRRTLGLTVDHRGLRVGAPRAVSLREIEGFVRGHGGWVLRKLDEWRARPATRILLHEGAAIPVLGAGLPLRLRPGSGSVQCADAAILAPADPAGSLARRLVAALKRKAAQVFAQRVAHYAPALAVVAPRIALSSAATRWGSCSTTGGVRLNWRLIHLPLDLIDYVVVHELAHLHEMNHSPSFWSVVERACPDWQARRARLKVAAATLPEL